MTKKNHIWIFNAAALGNGTDGAFSLEYHIPATKLKVDPKALVGSRVWLVMKDGSENFLYATITPSVIEIYQEGRYKDDLLLTAEAFFSIRFLPRHESRDPWNLPSLSGDEEIRECTDAEHSTFQEIVERNNRISFSPPSRTVLESVPRTAFTDLEHAVPDQLTSILRTVALGDVARTRSYPDEISVFGGIALTILKITCPEIKEADMVALIAALDPMAKMNDAPEESQQEILTTLSSLPPVVDTFLEEIDPDKISPRTFVAGIQNFSSEWIDKTNNAEQAHEQILKDLTLHLRDKGFKVYKSRSFDLFAEKAGERLLWEIKSAHGLNSVAQGEKGIVQLLRYSTALSGDTWKGVSFSLLLQDSGQTAIQQYLAKMGERAGVDLWLYNEQKDWPQRVSGLENDSPF